MQHLPSVRWGHHLRVSLLSNPSGPPSMSLLLFIACVRNVTKESLCYNGRAIDALTSGHTASATSVFSRYAFPVFELFPLQTFGSIINKMPPYWGSAEHSCSHWTFAGHRQCLYPHCPSLAGSVLSFWLQLGQAFLLMLEINWYSGKMIFLSQFNWQWYSKGLYVRA